MSSCPHCTTALPVAARYCPRCGEARLRRTTGQLPVDWRPDVPWAGIAFILSVLFAPAAVISGFWWQSPTLIWTGVVAAAVLLLVVVLAHFC